MKKGVKKKIKKTKEQMKKEVLVNVPNIITLSRLFLTFLLVYLIFTNSEVLLIAIVFVVAAASDWFDGYFARKLNQTSILGARLDQIVDRLFTIILVITLLVYFYMNGILFDKLSLLVLISSREIVGAVGFLIALTRKKDSYNVKYIGKFTTFIQSVSLGLILINSSLAIYFAFVTCVAGIFSALSYIKYALK